MRDLAVFAAVFGLLPFVFKRPAVGVLMFIWLSLMNPHRLTYGPAYTFPFAAVVAAVTIVALVLRRAPRKLPITPLTGTLLAFLVWMTLTGLTALNPDYVWVEWTRVMKTMLMVCIAMYVMTEEKDLRAMVWVIVLSLGFYGIKGGLFTLLTGGAGRVLGPEGSFIADNNALALANVMVAPLAWYLYMHARRKWLRYAMLAATLLIVLAALGSYSRGALLASAAMLLFLWTKSRHKLATSAAMALVIPIVFLIMPSAWFDRMHSIDDYQSDNSALGRINAWRFAINVASDNVMGGGFRTFSQDMFRIYAPNPLDVKVAHSIYFQVLGDHGYIGLLLFVSVLALTWRAGSRVIRRCKGQPDLLWASDLAAMIQVSLIGYAVGGAFLSLSYFDLFYYMLAALVILEKHLNQCERAAAPAAGASLPSRPAAAPA